MKYTDLRSSFKTNLFRLSDVYKFFPAEPPRLVQVQLYRFTKKGLIYRLKRELYCFDPDLIEPFSLANKLLEPSYVSLESALNFYGLIPDIPQAITSVTTQKTSEFKLEYGRFSFHTVKPKLYFGFRHEFLKEKGISYLIAEPEKALLDWIYLRQLASLADLRLNTKLLDKFRLIKYQAHYPKRVREMKIL